MSDWTQTFLIIWMSGLFTFWLFAKMDIGTRFLRLEKDLNIIKKALTELAHKTEEK
jgi:hypothetical protein